MKLFESCSIGHMELRNRMVMAPMSCNMTCDFQVTDQMVSFFEERAKGGVGLITIGDGIVEVPRGNNVKGSLAVDDDKYIPGLRRLVQSMHKHGAKTALQLSHGGRRSGRVSGQGCLEVTRGLIPVAPSILPHPVPGQVVPKALSKQEIKRLVHHFQSGARRALEAGFDAIGLHCAHMYLCGQFLSPWSNKREDQYGGALDARMKFVFEIMEAIQAVTEGHIPLIVRINGAEPPGGNSSSEIRTISKLLESAGADAIHVSVGFGAADKTIETMPSISPMRAPDGCIVHLAENVKKAVSIPVVAVNKLGDMALAEGVLQEEKADFVALGRPLIADPLLPIKAAAKRYSDIRPCIYCNEGCIKKVLEDDAPISCSVNPRAGFEWEKPIESRRPGKLIVLGGGPAGMQCALAADHAGHEVYLFERSDQLGGDLLLASVPIGKQSIENLRLFLVHQLERSRVKLLLGQEVTRDWLDAEQPDFAVLATGSRPVLPHIKGLSRDNCLTPAEVLAEGGLEGKRITIIGGGAVGCELAEYLCNKGNEVTLVEIEDEVARDKERINRLFLLRALESCGVRILTGTSVLEISTGLVVVSTGSKQERIPADKIIVAAGKQPAREDIDELIRSRVPKCFSIGDKVESRGILQAMQDGYNIVKEFF